MNFIIGFFAIFGLVVFSILTLLVIFAFWLIVAGATVEEQRYQDAIKYNDLEGFFKEGAKMKTIIWSPKKEEDNRFGK